MGLWVGMAHVYLTGKFSFVYGYGEESWCHLRGLVALSKAEDTFLKRMVRLGTCCFGWVLILVLSVLVLRRRIKNPTLYLIELWTHSCHLWRPLAALAFSRSSR